MKHPYSWLEEKTLPKLRNIIVGFFVHVLTTQLTLNIPTTGPQELLYGRIKEPNLADQMIAAWGERGALVASAILGYDFIFMIAVGLLFSVGCVLVSRNQRFSWVQPLGWMLAWAALFGTAFDWLETTLSIRLLSQAGPEWLPTLIQWCSNLKFAGWFSSLAFILIFWFVRLVTQTSKSDKAL
ncbi:MAG: hypothetical protein ACRCYY_04905 [Trueperaceae bacterium]